MTVFFLEALACAFVGIIPAFLAKKSGIGFIGILYFIVAFLLFYFGMPSLNYPGYGWVGTLAVVFMIITVVLSMASGSNNILPVIPPGIGVLFIVGVVISGMEQCNTTRYSSMIGNMNQNSKTVKEWTLHTQELDPRHIRTVPVEHANSIAKTALNQDPERASVIGSQFMVDTTHTTIQRIGNKGLYYALPLDFVSWGTWSGTSGSPGYVLVNAEDKSMAAKLYDTYNMVYTPEAYFNANLERHIYMSGYADKILADYSFEIDDNLNPFWVVTVCNATIGYDGLVVEGVLIIDPQTGHIDYKDKKNVPTWVDRVFPAKLVNNYVNWWGKWSNGYVNRTQFGSGVNVMEAEGTLLNYGIDSTCWFVTPVYSTGTHTMNDLIYTNSRTGESVRFQVSGSTEAAILETVRSRVKFQHLHPAEVVYENVSDRLTAIVSVLAEDESVAGVAFVDVDNKSNVAYDAVPIKALRSYQLLISQAANQLTTDAATDEVSYTGVVNRLSYDASMSGSQYYLYFKDKDQLFMVSTVYPEILVTKEGDSVSMRYKESKADMISVDEFDNLRLHIEGSENQQAMKQQRKEKLETTNTEKLLKDFKGDMKNGDIPDSAIVDMLKNKKKK